MRPWVRANNAMKSFVARLRTPVAGALLLASALGLALTSPVHGDAATTFAIYFDAPFVQGSYVYDDFPSDSKIATFEGSSSCSDPFGDNNATATVSGVCTPSTYPKYGGAATSTSAPAIGWPDVNTTPHYAVAGSTPWNLNFTSPQKYFGIWWSAGSVGNLISFYSGSTLIAALNADDVNNRFGSVSTVHSPDGVYDYATDLYYTNPVHFTQDNASYPYQEYSNSQLADGIFSSNASEFHAGSLGCDQKYLTACWNAGAYPIAYGEPFAYLHFFAAGTTTFDRVEIYSDGRTGFEFDNIVVSDHSNLLDSNGDVTNPRLIFVKSVHEAVTVTYDLGTAFGGYLCGYCWWVGSATQVGYEPGTLNPPQPWNDHPASTSVSWVDSAGDPVYAGDSFAFSSPATIYAVWHFQFAFHSSLGSEDADWVFPDSTAPMTVPTAPNLPDSSFAGWWTVDENGNFDQHVNVDTDGTVTVSDFLNLPIDLYPRWDIPTAHVPASIPVDPRALSVTFPEIPASSGFSVCVDEVDAVDSNNVVAGSNLSISFTQHGSTNGAGDHVLSDLRVSAASPLVATASPVIRIEISHVGDTTCSDPGTVHYWTELKPMALGTSFQTAVPIS